MPKGQPRNASVTFEGRSYDKGKAVMRPKYTAKGVDGKTKDLNGLTSEFATDEAIERDRRDIQRKIGDNGKKALVSKMDKAVSSGPKNSFKDVSVTQKADDFSDVVDMVKKKKTTNRNAY